MDLLSGSRNLLRSLLQKWFGPFTKDELKKYILLGIVFAFIIGTYWTLKPLKEAIFGSIVGSGSWLARVKIVSVLFLLPLVAIYGKLIERFARDRMFYLMGFVFAFFMVVWGIFFALPEFGLSNTVASPWRISGWLWYVFVESFGSLMVALFWAFMTDISDPKSAKYGFPLVVLIGQIGGILGPRFLSRIPLILGTNNAPLIAFCSLLVLSMMLLIFIFMKVTPAYLLEGFEEVKKKQKRKKSPGFFNGLKLLLDHKYLLGIFAVLAFFEIISTFIEFNFQVAVMNIFTSDVSRSIYLSNWGSTVNLVTFLCLFFGINNIQRWLGIRFALVLVPFLLFLTVFAFKYSAHVDVLFWLMVVAKSINYALNGPTLKQLYVPTTKDVKYKSQAWIETFGSRGAKASSSGLNAFREFIGVSAYFAMAIYLSFGLLFGWLFIALFLGKKYNEAISSNEVVC
ncbi:hypothetical protein HN446_03515 [bacterium]|jgi:ATP:ADP antiporter, AAA family|nr:hypothetical protein [bacterium]